MRAARGPVQFGEGFELSAREVSGVEHSLEMLDDGDGSDSPRGEYIDLELSCASSFSKNNGQARASSLRLPDQISSNGHLAESLTGSPVEETIELGHNCYTLILVSGRVSVLAPMLVMAAGQFGLLWIVAWSSPEYFFESGQWIVPISDYWPVNAMKGLSLLLTLFRVTGEFKDASKLYQVLSGRTVVPLSSLQRLLGSSAFVLQYLVAVAVLFMAIHLILASTTPIGTIGKIWVVFMTLEFDNYLCSFILFVFNCEDAFQWKVKLQHRRSSRRPMSSPARKWMSLYWVPACIAILVVSYSLHFNICPLTALHYGIVGNERPVLMLTATLGLPKGCCSPQVTFPEDMVAGRGTSVQVSVPCLSTGIHEQGTNSSSPLMYYVVVPDGRPNPSSLQVMQGQAGDGNMGLRHGHVATRELQMRWWLTLHGFGATVYDAMRSTGSGGMGLYQSSFPYLAEWEIQDFPWHARARVFAVAVNVATGSLSPAPVQSALITRKVCAPHCQKCDSEGACWSCEHGFVLQALDKICLPCTSGCSSCESTGPGKCDRGGCALGNGLAADGSCLPCAGSTCASCDEVLPTSTEPPTSSEPSSVRRLGSTSSTPGVLPCVSCPEGFGLAPDADGCQLCETEGCSRCNTDLDDECQVCRKGLTLIFHQKVNANGSSMVQACLPCADHCASCALLGPGHCDPEQCDMGFSLTPTGVCAPCSSHCANCTRSGPGHCDAGYCRVGYGLQGSTECSKCQADQCDSCDSGPGRCDSCHEGFGSTPDQGCEACADACKRCTGAGELDSCAQCSAGFGVQSGRCLACADQCDGCDVSGPGQCDEGSCAVGWKVKHLPGLGPICVRNAMAMASQRSHNSSQTEQLSE